MACSLGEWVSFFVKAGIPHGEAASYALIFSKNRIQQNMLADLNKEYLLDMGITPLGDIIAILKHARAVHESASREMIMSEASKKNLDELEKSRHRFSSENQEALRLNTLSNKPKQQDRQIIDKRENPETLLTDIEKKLADVERRGLRKLGPETSEPPSTSDTTDESDETQTPVTLSRLEPEKRKINQHVIKSENLFLNVDSHNESQQKKLCVFSRLGNAATKMEDSPLPQALEGLVTKDAQRNSSNERNANSGRCELKMLKITTEFSDDEDVEVNVPETAVATKFVNRSLGRLNLSRKRSNTNIEPTKMPSVSTQGSAKKVRFGGTSTHVISEDSNLKSDVFRGHTIVLKSQAPISGNKDTRTLIYNKTVQTREVAGRSLRLNSDPQLTIKSRVGVVKPTPAHPISKMVSDLMMAKGEVSKSVKSRIDLKNKGGKASVLERIG